MGQRHPQDINANTVIADHWSAMSAFENCTYDYRQGDVISGNQFDDAIGRDSTGDDSWWPPADGDETWERHHDDLMQNQQLRCGGQVFDGINQHYGGDDELQSLQHQQQQQHYDGRICNQSVEGAEEYPDSHNCVIAFAVHHELSWTPLNVAVYGYVHPAVVAATMVTNCLVCAVLLRRSMRTPTSTLLVAMAVSDALTGLLPTPCFIAFHTFGMCHDYVPYPWCLPYILLTDHLPTVFHTASIWLTVALAAQRYIHVCHPPIAKRLCTVSNMLRVIFVVYAAAFAAQLPRMLELRVGKVLVPSMLDPTPLEPTIWYDGCYIDFVPMVSNHMRLYFGIYYWLRVVFTHLVPCTALVVLNAMLTHTMSIARRRRSQLLSNNRRTVTVTASNAAAAAADGDAAAAAGASASRGHRRQRSEYRRLGDGIATTLMLVVVVGLLLSVELPLACFLVLMTLENTWGYALLPEGAFGYASLTINLLIVCSYPVNFFIYCGMSRQFRQTFASLFSPTGGAAVAEARVRGGVNGRVIGTASDGHLRVPMIVGGGTSTGGGPAGGLTAIDADCPSCRPGSAPPSVSVPCNASVASAPAATVTNRRVSSSLFARLQRRTTVTCAITSVDPDRSTPLQLMTRRKSDDAKQKLQLHQCIALIGNGTSSHRQQCCLGDVADGDERRC